MKQKQSRLSELQETIKELHKLGVFSEEELAYLQSIDKSVDELSKEFQDKLVVGFINHSDNPDPTLDGNKILLRTNLSDSVIISPNNLQTVKTEIAFSLPDNVVLSVTTPRTLLFRGISVVGYYFYNDYLMVSLVNHNNSHVIITHGEELVEIYFTYCLSNDTVVLERFES
jgi:dUTPase